jgi:DNA-binding NtrC family response regulator
MAQSKIVSDSDLPEAIRLLMTRPDKGTGLMTLEEVQSRHIEYILKLVEGNKARAAKILGVSRATIYDMLARRTRQVDPKKKLSA